MQVKSSVFQRHDSSLKSVANLNWIRKNPWTLHCTSPLAKLSGWPSALPLRPNRRRKEGWMTSLYEPSRLLEQWFYTPSAILALGRRQFPTAWQIPRIPSLPYCQLLCDGQQWSTTSTWQRKSFPMGLRWELRCRRPRQKYSLWSEPRERWRKRNLPAASYSPPLARFLNRGHSHFFCPAKLISILNWVHFSNLFQLFNS